MSVEQTPQVARIEPDPDGLAAARAVAGWHLGHTDWADILVGAYLNPTEALERLKKDKAR